MKTQKQLIKLGEKLANHPISQNLIKSPIKTRNQTALNPLLKKGGVHDKDNPKTHHKKERAKIRLHLKHKGYENTF